MRKFLFILLILALAIAGGALYLKATTPESAAGVRFPLSPRQEQLLASVPESAETFALVPTAAAVHAKLLQNPVTRGPVQEWTAGQQLPRAWMIGGADLVIWKSGKQTSYAVHLDAFRAALIRMYLMFASGPDAEVKSNGTFLINAGSSAPLGVERVRTLMGIGKGLPAGDALIVQLDRSRAAFPPIGRPAVTSLQIGKSDLMLTSRSANDGVASTRPAVSSRFARGALLSASFTDPPRVVEDLDRLLGKVSRVLDGGGSIILYDVDSGTLLPHPKGLMVVPATAEKRAAVEKIREVAEALGEVRESSGRILMSFDRSSAATYMKETFVDSTWPANDWAVRFDAQRLLPVVQDLGGSTGLRLAAPRLYRSVKEMKRWTDFLAQADAVEASHSNAASVEELKVRITAK